MEMTDDQVQAIRCAFKSAFATFTGKELKELMMADSRALKEEMKKEISGNA